MAKALLVVKAQYAGETTGVLIYGGSVIDSVTTADDNWPYTLNTLLERIITDPIFELEDVKTFFATGHCLADAAGYRHGPLIYSTGKVWQFNAGMPSEPVYVDTIDAFKDPVYPRNNVQGVVTEFIKNVVNGQHMTNSLFWWKRVVEVAEDGLHTVIYDVDKYFTLYVDKETGVFKWSCVIGERSHSGNSPSEMGNIDRTLDDERTVDWNVLVNKKPEFFEPGGFFGEVGPTVSVEVKGGSRKGLTICYKHNGIEKEPIVIKPVDQKELGSHMRILILAVIRFITPDEIVKRYATLHGLLIWSNTPVDVAYSYIWAPINVEMPSGLYKGKVDYKNKSYIISSKAGETVDVFKLPSFDDISSIYQFILKIAKYQ